MKRIVLCLLIHVCVVGIVAQSFVASGGKATPVPYTDNVIGTQISTVYLFNTLSGATLTYSSAAAVVKFYRFAEGVQQEVPADDIGSSTSGSQTRYVISGLLDGYGYMAIENNNTQPRTAVWIIDYAQHLPTLNSITPIENEDVCQTLKLMIDKSDDLPFYGVAGNKKSVLRKYTISYQTQEWSDAQKKFVSIQKDIPEKIIGTETVINAPLQNTRLKLSGDQFAAPLGIKPAQTESDMYNAIAVVARIDSEKVSDGSTTNEGDSQGYSAPIAFDYKGRANEPVAQYYTWMIYNLQDLKNPVARYTDQNITYHFDRSGKFKVVLEVANATSSCVVRDSIPLVEIFESELLAPNFFSPDDTPGINDEFKVYYKSIIKFKCTIFNRNGSKLYQWTDPAKGWDGRYGGRLVNTGVYYYVIEAEGSDGRKFKEGGPINIIRKR